MDGSAVARCMSVALSAAQEAVCRSAIVPVELVACTTVQEAVKVMATVLPLVVVVDVEMPDTDRAAVDELAQAVGAEMFDLTGVPGAKELAVPLLEALVRAERRRMGPSR